MAKKCPQKRRYATKLDAKIALSKIRRDDSEKRVYFCPICRGYHLTSQPHR